jgi:ABC-type polysaccharide/polyol phosphate transport system ATPase subunit
MHVLEALPALIVGTDRSTTAFQNIEALAVLLGLMEEIMKHVTQVIDPV